MAGNICQIPPYQGGSTKGAKGAGPSSLKFLDNYDNNRVRNKHTIRFCNSCSSWCPGTSAPDGALLSL